MLDIYLIHCFVEYFASDESLNFTIKLTILYDKTVSEHKLNFLQALDICDKLLAQHVYTVVASHPNGTDRSPISVSYTCGYYNIPVLGISARDSAFSDVVSFWWIQANSTHNNQSVLALALAIKQSVVCFRFAS